MGYTWLVKTQYEFISGLSFTKEFFKTLVVLLPWFILRLLDLQISLKLRRNKSLIDSNPIHNDINMGMML